MTLQILEKIKIDKRSSLPIHIQLIQSLKTLMLSHDISYMDKLPDINDLSNVLKIRKSDIDLAYQRLLNENYIHKKDTLYYVNYFHFSANFYLKVIKLYDAIKDMGMTPSMKSLVKKSTHLPMELRKHLTVNSDCKYYQIKRLYYGNNTPLIILDTYLLASKFENLLSHINDGEALYETLFKHYDVSVASSKRIFSVTNLDKETAEQLNTVLNTASYYGISISYDKNNQLVDITRSWSSSNYFFEIELKREEIEKMIRNHLYYI